MDNKKILDIIEECHKNGEICIMTSEGLMKTPIKEFIKQPASGILYDLNRLEEVTISLLENGHFENSDRWINDIAVAKVIKELCKN